ncbi:MAG: rRNA maturation RNase YbeY [Candidatus Paceibacterota bacterium]|jgi:probable rRNA maturation factor
MAGVEISNLTRREAPRFAYSDIAKAVIPSWEISLVFVGPKQAQELNVQLRKKTYTPNILSYALGEKSGEIFICLHEAAKQAPLHNMNEREFILYLFIHGLLHLKGMAHGGTMEECERKLVAKFAERTSAHDTEDSDRNRHRHLPSKSGGSRGAC